MLLYLLSVEAHFLGATYKFALYAFSRATPHGDSCIFSHSQ